MSEPEEPTFRWDEASESDATALLSSRPGASGDARPRFLPGALLGGRYRIVSFLGRGGMGEVYRAEDLKLGQKVALKFLPSGAGVDEQTIAQLISEVRVGRRVSHPNVCRLHDFVEADGLQFLTMELVEGEDLGSLLRARGRLEESLVLRIAHDICAGLGAAHAQGVLHRDLKPGNVLLDGTGRALISDFGLATVLQDRPAPALSGTPAYMAPELLRGGPASPQSDLFALGVVLYELLTGHRPFEATSLREAMSETRPAPLPPSHHVHDVDPRVERIIMQCLDPDPARRPPSAAWLNEHLPGEDPLHAAIAMGITPTRAMVAAARGGALSRRASVTIVATTAAALALVVVFAERTSVHRMLVVQATTTLERRAIDIARIAGVRPGSYRWSWFSSRTDELRDAMKDRSPLGERIPSPVRFVFRSSSDPLVPRFASASDVPPMVTESEPPLASRGSLRVILDSSGRLTDLVTVPDMQGPPIASDIWTRLNAASAIALPTLRAVAPARIPETGHDQRLAWTARTQSGVPVRIEAASLAGRPVAYHVATREEVTVARGNKPILVALMIVFLGGSALLARRNFKVGRGDLTGATRVAATVLTTWFSWWLIGGAATTGALFDWSAVSHMLWQGLYWAFIMWLGYIGLEPFIRRRWPHLLVGWTRLFDGRFLDPLVGRDVLIGVAAGVALALLRQLRVLLPMVLDLPRSLPFDQACEELGGSRAMLEEIAARFFSAFGDALGSLLIFLVLRVVTRSTWVASAIWILVITALNYSPRGSAWIILATTAAFVVIMLVVMVRWGLLALTTALFTTIVLHNTPLTLDIGVPYAGAAMTGLGAIVALMLYGLIAAQEPRTAPR